MTMPLEDLEAEALQLTPEERARLADRMLASLAGDSDIENEWFAEVQRRIAAVESRAAPLIPLDEAIAKARRALA